MSDEVLLMDILSVYAREQGKGEVRDYRLRNTYNPATISVEIEYVDKLYLESLVEQLKVGVKLDPKDSAYVARLLTSHPILDSFVYERPSPFTEIHEEEPPSELPTDRETILDRYDSPTYGDLQSPSAAKILEDIHSEHKGLSDKELS